MNYARDICRLRRYIMLGQAVSLLISLFGLLAVMLFIDPSMVGVSDEWAGSYRGDWVWLLTGALFIVFAGVCMVVPGKWSRRLVWIYRNVKPASMALMVHVDEDSDRTSYYAVMSADEGPVWRVSLYIPGWDVGGLKGREVPAKVYFDPRTQRPAVIETEGGLLWRMAGGGAAERLT